MANQNPPSRRTRTILVLAVVAALALAACGNGISITIDDNGDEVDGSGTIVTEARDVGDFDEVTLTGQGIVVVAEGPAPSLTVTTDDNLMSFIETSVSGGTLQISTENGVDIDPTDSVRYQVTAPDINKLTLTGAGAFEMAAVDADRFGVVLTGAGDVTIDELSARDLDVDITGVGSVVVAGEVTSQTVDMPGAGSYDGSDLKSAAASITNSGVGSATVWVTDELDASITGVGSIDYYGTPELTTSVTGIGKVNSRGAA